LRRPSESEPAASEEAFQWGKSRKEVTTMSDEELKAMLYEAPEIFEIGNANDLILGDAKVDRKDAEQTGLEFAC
jgi:hypothetical protein